MHGGGIFVRNGATLDLRNSAVVDNKTRNSTEAIGGGIFFAHTGGHFITNSVIAYNHSAFFTGGVYLGGSGIGASVTVTRSIIASNSADQPAAVDLSTQDPVNRPFLSGGKNRLGNAAAGFVHDPNETGLGDYIKPTGVANPYVVTGIADTYDRSDDAVVTSTRDAIDRANNTAGAQEIWLPAWDFVLTRERLADDALNVGYGDLEITQPLTIRGINGLTSVAWASGLPSDKVFELVGDYNFDGVVNNADSVACQKFQGYSGSNLPWDGNDDGTVNQLDKNLVYTYFGTSLTLEYVIL